MNPITSRMKAQLKMAINRLRLIQNRDTAIAKQQRRAMAELLEQGKEQSARIRVENIVRQDENVELLEMLELYCELLLARIGLLEAKECDPGLEEAVTTIIYTAPRTEVKELQQLREIFAHKFGKEFAQAASDNSKGLIQQKVLRRLSTDPPSQELVTLYLTEIAKAYNVPFGEFQPNTVGEEELLQNDNAPQAADSAASPASGETSSIAVTKPAPTTDNPQPRLNFNKEQQELDALQARFDALRRR